MAHIVPAMRIAPSIARVVPAITRKSGPAAPKSEIAVKPPVPSSGGSPPDPAADFRALFTSRSNPPAQVASTPVAGAPAMAPSAQALFGDNPWMSNPGGVASNGVTYGYNPYYFATAATAEKVAQMVGGKVVQSNALTPYGPFQQNQPNYMVQLPNGRQIYAGLFASFFDHGYTQDFVNRLIASEISDTGMA